MEFKGSTMALSRYQGTGQFGLAYQIMLENDPHAPGSVDRVLMERMIRLCPETAPYLYTEYTPTQVRYEKGSRPEIERYVGAAISGCRSDEERLEGLVTFTSSLGEAAHQDLDAMRVGGTEEEIIARGSDWCADVARVGCVLCQVAGFPARLVYLADTQRAYSGHVIIEVFRWGAWGAADPATAVVYRHPDGRPASTWDLMNQPHLIQAHWRGAATPYTTVEQFRSAAISNYFVSDRQNYDYTISPINAYYRAILEMSHQGWPGGLRWLHGEDIWLKAGQR